MDKSNPQLDGLEKRMEIFEARITRLVEAMEEIKKTQQALIDLVKKNI